MSRLRLITLALAATTMAGCSLEPHYGCPAPDGVACMSVSDVYKRDARGEIHPATITPHNQSGGGDTAPDSTPSPTGFLQPLASKPGDPIFREPHRLRIWIVDWESTDGVYDPNHYVYIRLDDGQWLLPKMRARLLDETNAD